MVGGRRTIPAVGEVRLGGARRNRRCPAPPRARARPVRLNRSSCPGVSVDESTLLKSTFVRGLLESLEDPRTSRVANAYRIPSTPLFTLHPLHPQVRPHPAPTPCRPVFRAAFPRARAPRVPPPWHAPGIPVAAVASPPSAEGLKRPRRRRPGGGFREDDHLDPPRPRPPRDLDPRRVADARAGLASASRSSATIPFLVAAASRHSTARGSGRFATFVRAELSLGSRKTLRLLRFVPKLAYGLGSGRLNATTRAGASFSAPPTRGARVGPRPSTRASQPRLSALDGRERSEMVRGAPNTPPKGDSRLPTRETARVTRERGRNARGGGNARLERSGSTRGTRAWG